MSGQSVNSKLNHSQQEILRRLKLRGPQSVKILASQLEITPMGARQHLAELDSQGLVENSRHTRQKRGRPVQLWQLTEAGHRHFADAHAALSVEILDAVEARLGSDGLDRVVESRHDVIRKRYQQSLAAAGENLLEQVQALARLRSEEGYMAEIRLLPDGWLLIENHCPIVSAARRCQQFCGAELALFRAVLGEMAHIERIDHLLAGARRCAYKISAP